MHICENLHTLADTYFHECKYTHLNALIDTHAHIFSYKSHLTQSLPIPYPPIPCPPTPYPSKLTQLSDQQNGWLCLAKTLIVTRADAERTIQAYIGALFLPLPVSSSLKLHLPLPLPQSLSPTLSSSSVTPLSLPLTTLSTQPLSVQDTAQSSYGALHSVPLSALLQVQYVQYVLLIFCLYMYLISFYPTYLSKKNLTLFYSHSYSIVTVFYPLTCPTLTPLYTSAPPSLPHTSHTPHTRPIGQ